MLRDVGLKAGMAVWRSQRHAEIPKSLAISSHSSVGLRAFTPNGQGNKQITWRFTSHATTRNQFVGQIKSVKPSSSLLDLRRSASIRHETSLPWRRHAHTQSKREHDIRDVQHKSSLTQHSNAKTSSTVTAHKAGSSSEFAQPKLSTSHKGQPTPSILDRLPHLPALHRPSREELLGAATGAWSRFKIHFKWFSIRSFRPWNVDDISAFFTWIIAGHLIWILVGTTTFFSLLILMINTVFAQESLARWIGNYLTKASGIKVIFESAVVPKWKDGVISFHNVFVSRRPGQGGGQVKKGSQSEAAAAAQVATLQSGPSESEDDGNYTQFDVSIDTVNVTFSFAKWFNGKGLLRDVEIKGIRGVVDRTHVVSSVWADIDPRTWKHEHQTGDFELDSFKMEDLFITVYQPAEFRPFPVSIHLCELPRLRKQWLFYDFISANVMSGAYDNAMFAIHPRQEYNHTGLARHHTDEDASHWKKHARFRIDGLNIDHLNRGVEGMFAWIKEGKVDIVSDMMFPSDDEGIAKVMSDFYDRVEATVASSTLQFPLGTPASKVPAALTESTIQDGQHEGRAIASHPVAGSAAATDIISESDDAHYLVMDVRVQLNDIRATVPLFTRDISYMNNALIRPIVAYMNSRRAFIPVNCRVVKRISDFDGSWTMYDSGLMEDLNQEIYKAFARDVLDDDQLRRRRFKKVGVWTLQLAAQALFIGLAGNIA